MHFNDSEESWSMLFRIIFFNTFFQFCNHRFRFFMVQHGRFVRLYSSRSVLGYLTQTYSDINNHFSSTMSRLPTSDQRTLPKPSSNGSRIQLQRTNLPSPKKSTNPKPTNSTLEKKTNGVSGLKPPSGISKIGECILQGDYKMLYKK